MGFCTSWFLCWPPPQGLLCVRRALYSSPALSPAHVHSFFGLFVLFLLYISVYKSRPSPVLLFLTIAVLISVILFLIQGFTPDFLIRLYRFHFPDFFFFVFFFFPFLLISSMVIFKFLTTQKFECFTCLYYL